MKNTEFKQKKKNKLATAISLIIPIVIAPYSLAETYHVNTNNDDGTGLISETLSQAILNANTHPGTDTIILNTDVKITGVMKRLINSDLTITSDSIKRNIDGDELFRPLFIKSGQVILSRINIINGKAKGGNAGNTGAGAGMGGGLFIYGGEVTLEFVDLINNRAQNGNTINVACCGSGSGGGMYGAGNNRNGGGLFAHFGYGGYGNYRDTDPRFGEGGIRFSLTQQDGGFGGGGGYYYESKGNGGKGGFGGGGGFCYYGNGGDGGFGAGGGGVEYSYNFQGKPGYGGYKLEAAGMGGAIFLRSGKLQINNVSIENNHSLAINGAKGLGGGLFILHSLVNSNGNNQGMPTTLGTVTGCGLSFKNNSASGDPNTNNNNDDLFDLADLNTVTDSCSHEIEITGNNRLISDGDDTPIFEDGTFMGTSFANSSLNSTQFQVRNLGGQDLNLIGNPLVTLLDNSNNAFAVVNSPNQTIGAGDSDFLQISFSPTQVGLHSAIVSVPNSDDDEAGYNFAINAFSVGSELHVLGSGKNIFAGDATPRISKGTYFGELASQMEFTIENQGVFPLLLNGIGIIGPDTVHFTISQQPRQSTLNPGESTQFIVSFNPASVGYFDAEIKINSNDVVNNVFRFRIAGGKDIGDFHITESEDDGSGMTINSLSWAILQANEQPGHQLITIDEDVLFTGVQKRLINSDMTIKSSGPIKLINGNDKYRPFFIKSGQVIIDRLDIVNGKAKGGKPGKGQYSSSSGGGAGMGAGIFVYDGDVLLKSMLIKNSKATAPNTFLPRGPTNRHTGGGGMYFGADVRNSGGAGMFAETTDYSGEGGYGGYGNYQDISIIFGKGGNYTSLRHGGFGGGGGAHYTYKGTAMGGNGGFGGGPGATYSYYGTNSRGKGGFGGAGGFGGVGAFGAAMGGALFIRSGQVELKHVELYNNEATPNGDSKGLGGAIFILHTLDQPNGNNQGMPVEFATVSGCNVSFDSNSAKDDDDSQFNNDDLFDMAQRFTQNDKCEIDMTYDLIFISNFE